MTNIAFVRFLSFMDCVEKAFFFHGLFAHECFICFKKDLLLQINCICKVSSFNIISRIQILFFVVFLFLSYDFFFYSPTLH